MSMSHGLSMTKRFEQNTAYNRIHSVKVNITPENWSHAQSKRGGINLSTDSYLPPEVRVRLVRLVTHRHYGSPTAGEFARCINYALFGQYKNSIDSRL